ITFLRKPEISCFQTIGEQDIQKRNDRIYLGQVSRTGGLCKQQRQRQIHQVAKKPTGDRRNTIPKCLSCQFFNAAQEIDLVVRKSKVTGIFGIYWSGEGEVSEGRRV